MKEGRDVVRLFRPDSMRWETLPGVKLSEYRWYPTQVQLPDDRVVIVSGFLDDPGVPTGKPAPSIDVFDYRSKQIVARRSRYDLGKGFFTNVTPGYQLYPTVFLMPWTDPDAPGELVFGFGFLIFARARSSLLRSPFSLILPSPQKTNPPTTKTKNNRRLLPLLLHLPDRADRPPHPAKRVQSLAHLARSAHRQHLRRLLGHGLGRHAPLQKRKRRVLHL